MEICKKTNVKGTDQSVWMRRLVCAFVVLKPPKTGFLATRRIFTLMVVFSAKLKKLKKDKVIENGDEEDEVSQELLTPFLL